MTSGVDVPAMEGAGKDLPRSKGKYNPVRVIEAHRFGITLLVLIVCFVVVSLWSSILVSNQSGQQGVYWSRFFGGTSDRILGEGTHLKFPWDEIVIYNMRAVEVHGKSLMLTKDGLEIDVIWSVLYRPEEAELPKLHRKVGPLFEEKIVVPEAISTLRQILGNYTAEEIYSRDERTLIGEMHNRVKAHIEVYPIVVESILILRLDLPKEMSKGIVDKLLAEQKLLAYRFRTKGEEAERGRKIIEAEGIKAFEEISKISILKWRGIEATTEIAKSPNTKIVIMGTGPNGMPLLLNADK